MVAQNSIINNFVIENLAKILLVWSLQGVRLQVISITTKIPERIDQIIASLYLQYLYSLK